MTQTEWADKLLQIIRDIDWEHDNTCDIQFINKSAQVILGMRKQL